MQNKELPLFQKGNYQEISTAFMTEGHEMLQQLAVVQEKYGKNDTDVFINELRDSMAGYYLGFELVNTEKHGFDCKRADGDEYLEVKSASFVAKSWQATFNDTTLEKAEAFKDKKLWLALAVWKNASDLLFVAYGQSSAIGDYLEGKVNHFKTGATVRSTQSVTLGDLVFKYKFVLLTPTRSKQEVKEILQLKDRKFMNLPDNQLLTLEEFNKKYGDTDREKI